MARPDGARILQLDRAAVRYVQYDPSFFHDYRKVSIDFDEMGRGRMTFVVLPLDGRQPGERFTDEHIMNIAGSGGHNSTGAATCESIPNAANAAT
jgi:hypothetical protein